MLDESSATMRQSSEQDLNVAFLDSGEFDKVKEMLAWNEPGCFRYGTYPKYSRRPAIERTVTRSSAIE